MTALKDDQHRIERDALGEYRVPADAYYGIHTARAADNFAISGYRFDRRLIVALGTLKWAAARANAELGLLEAGPAEAILAAADEVARGDWDDQFIVDVFQTGSGTSTNMNANEVIANRANELLGSGRGTYAPVHPNDHVNLGQSSNDVIPTALHLAVIHLASTRLVPALKGGSGARGAAVRQHGILKTGRTHLMDATPIRLGQEFRDTRARWRSPVPHSSARWPTWPRFRSAARRSGPASTPTAGSREPPFVTSRRAWASR